MKVFVAAAELIAGTVLVSFACLSFSLFPRPFSFDNPSLLMELFFIAGLALLALGLRGLLHIHRALGKQSHSPLTA